MGPLAKIFPGWDRGGRFDRSFLCWFFGRSWEEEGEGTARGGVVVRWCGCEGQAGEEEVRLPSEAGRVEGGCAGAGGCGGGEDVESVMGTGLERAGWEMVGGEGAEREGVKELSDEGWSCEPGVLGRGVGGRFGWHGGCDVFCLGFATAIRSDGDRKILEQPYRYQRYIMPRRSRVPYLTPYPM